LSEVVRIALALALLTAAMLKLASPDASRAALATFGVPALLRAPTWGALAALEGILAVTVALGSDSAAFAAAAFCTLSAGVLVVAIRRGRTGAPCGCFGVRSRVGWPGVARNIILAAGFATVPWLPTGSPGTEGWLAVGLALAFACVLALGVAVLALAREVGLLRLRVGGQPALEIPDEGPAIGARLGLIERFRADDGTRFALAVFSSDGCRLCRSLEPAVAAFRRDPLVTVEVFDEMRDADVWRELNIPGSPFAIALGRDGAVRAKGTFNSFGQLESILATAERRLAEAGA
jgi:Methylamine utilisation protein MauE